MPAIKTGRKVPCCICSKEVYKTKAYIARGTRITCGSFDCKSKNLQGTRNPFWGRSHTKETVSKIMNSEGHKNRRKGGPPKGFKHTSEERAKMSERMKTRWRVHRDKMLECLPKQVLKPKEELRYRRNFSDAQRREWKSTECAWCRTQDNLILDHIIPVMCGGENERINSQTLCQPCNLWKMVHVDRPLFLAGLGGNLGQN